MKNDLFSVPRKRLQKSIYQRGRTPEENAIDYVNVRKQEGTVQFKRQPFDITDFCALTEVAANKNTARARNVLQGAIYKSNEASYFLEKALDELDQNKAKLKKMVDDLQRRCLANIKSREEDKVDCMSKVAAYLAEAKQFKAEKEKQDMLIRIGYIVEALHDQLGPYEELLGKLALQENSFKSKADTLSIRKDILRDRREILSEKLKNTLYERSEIRKALFYRIFNLRETTHADLNKVNKLLEKDVKTMRTVLDKENRLTTIRKRARLEEAERAKFYWFLDWVLTDVIGMETVAEITLSSSPQEKAQTIMDYYKNLKSFTSNLPGNRSTRIVEMIL